MQQTLRPYVTTGIAVVGTGLIVVVPAAPQLPRLGQPLSPLPQRDIALAADGSLLSPWAELFTNTFNNLAALGAGSGFPALLTQIFTNPGESWTNLPDAVGLMTTLMPDISVQFAGFPLQVGMELPPQLALLLSEISPWVTVYNAFNDIINQIVNPSDPFGPFAAIINAPAILLNAFLNGQNGVDFGGIHIPLFNGILVPSQTFDLQSSLGELVDQAGFGNSTITDLLDQAGIGQESIASLLGVLFDSMGIGDLTPVELLDQFGIGQETLATLAIAALGEAGIDNPTITELIEQLAGPDQTVAGLLSGLLDAAGFGNPTITGLLEEFGMGDVTVGGLLKDLLTSSGFGNPSITEMLVQFGFGDATVGSLVTQMLGNPSLTDLLVQLGMGGMTVGDLVTMALGDFGNQTPLDLFDQLTTPDDTSMGDMTLADFVTYLLNLSDPSMDWTLQEALQNLDMPLNGSEVPLGSWTLGDLLSQSFDGAPPYGYTPWKEVLSSVPNPFDPNDPTSLGDMTYAALCTASGQSSSTCSNLPKLGIPNGTTLNDTMGNRTLLETLQNLKNSSGVPMANMTMGDLIKATNYGDVKISDIFFNLQTDVPLTNTMNDILTQLGLNDTSLNTILVDGWGLNNKTVVDLLSDFGLNNLSLASFLDNLGLNDVTLVSVLDDLGLNDVHLFSLIDGLGLDNLTLVSVLSDLGLDNLDVDTLLNRLLGDLPLGAVLDDLNLDNVHLNDVIEVLLGSYTLSGVLSDIGLDSTDLNTIVANLGLGEVTLNSVLSSWGLDTVTVDHILDNMGLSDLDVLNLHAGDFAGWMGQLFDVIPQQLADALGG